MSMTAINCHNFMSDFQDFGTKYPHNIKLRSNLDFLNMD